VGQLEFGLIAGVKRVAIGYHGKERTEAVRVEFDTRRISYEHLLAVFFELHPPDCSSIVLPIWYHTVGQQHAAALELASRGRDSSEVCLAPAIPWRDAVWSLGGFF